MNVSKCNEPPQAPVKPEKLSYSQILQKEGVYREAVPHAGSVRLIVFAHHPDHTPSVLYYDGTRTLETAEHIWSEKMFYRTDERVIFETVK
jgi:hypothetical protein